MSAECRWFFCCPMKRYNERGLVSDEMIGRYCRGDWRSCVRYRMVERGEYHPDWMLPDGALDERLRGR